MSAIHVYIVLSFLFLTAVYILIQAFVKQEKKQRTILNDLEAYDKTLDLLFPRKDNALWMSNGREVIMDEEYAKAHGIGMHVLPLGLFYAMVHPDSKHYMATLMEYANMRGRFVMRLQLSFDEGKTWSWHEMSYTATDETARTQRLYGYMRSIDKEMAEEKKLDNTYKEAKQMELKEEFLANMTADLSAPLNTIKEQSLMLIDRKDCISAEQSKICRDKVNENIQSILQIIKDALSKAKNINTALMMIILSMLTTSCDETYAQTEEVVTVSISALLVLVLAGMAVMVLRLRWYIRHINYKKAAKERRSNALKGAGCRTFNSIHEIKQLLQRIHPDHHDMKLLVKEAMMKNNEVHEFDILTDIDDSGEYKWWKMRFIIHSLHDNEMQLDGLLIDINDSKSRESQLRTAIKDVEDMRKKADFLMTINHEIRTPLNAVQGFCEVLATTNPSEISDEDFATYSHLINEYYEKGRNMLQNIKFYSLSETKKMSYNIEVFDAIPLVSEIAEEWSKRIPKEIVFTSPAFFEHVYVNADKEKVRYILNGLLDNAVKFTKKGRVTIFTAYNYAEKMVVFYVVDTGCGIAADKQEYVFELFSKVDAFVPGLGLSLNLAQSMARYMGGYIILDSEPDMGTTTSLHLPAKLK